MPASVIEEFIHVAPPLLDAKFVDVVWLLEVASVLDSSISNPWVNRVV